MTRSIYEVVAVFAKVDESCLRLMEAVYLDES